MFQPRSSTATRHEIKISKKEALQGDRTCTRTEVELEILNFQPVRLPMFGQLTGEPSDRVYELVRYLQQELQAKNQ